MAFAEKHIREFRGSCVIQVREDCIVIKGSNGKEMGSWPYVYIREFRFDDEKFQFSFKSGRRGPFGVADYLFKLHNRTYYNLRETVNRIAEGKSGNVATGDHYKPPVPPHASNSKSGRHQKQEAQEYTYDDLPTIRSVGHHRSASNPDLSKDFPIGHFLRKECGSTRSNPSDPNSPGQTKKVSADTVDYQVPKPVTEAIYNIPRHMSDPRNDYHIPKPLEDTYKVPRAIMPHPMARSRQIVSDSTILLETPEKSILEHNYEDPDVDLRFNSN